MHTYTNTSTQYKQKHKNKHKHKQKKKEKANMSYLFDHPHSPGQTGLTRTLGREKDIVRQDLVDLWKKHI